MRAIVCLMVLTVGVWASAQSDGDRAYRAHQYTKAFGFYSQSCHQEKDAEGCFDLAMLYENGEGVERDYLLAAQLYKDACTQGSGNGCNALGVLYEDGDGVVQDDLKAKEFYQKACQLHVTSGCDNYRTLNRR